MVRMTDDFASVEYLRRNAPDKVQGGYRPIQRLHDDRSPPSGGSAVKPPPLP